MQKGEVKANPSFHHHFGVKNCNVILAARVLASLVIRCLHGKMQRKVKQATVNDALDAIKSPEILVKPEGLK